MAAPEQWVQPAASQNSFVQQSSAVRLNFRSITIEVPGGAIRTTKISAEDWLEIGACQNMKQRIRMLQFYYHAEKNNCIVAGTMSKSEVLQGFYARHRDGGADIESIAHL